MATLALPLLDWTDGMAERVIGWYRQAGNQYLRFGDADYLAAIEQEIRVFRLVHLQHRDSVGSSISADICAWVEKLYRWCKQEPANFRKLKLAETLEELVGDIGAIWFFLPADKRAWAYKKHGLAD